MENISLLLSGECYRGLPCIFFNSDENWDVTRGTRQRAGASRARQGASASGTREELGEREEEEEGGRERKIGFGWMQGL